MRILFLCGSLEAGRDGVGDYTRLLAGECARLGHAVAIVALRDRHLGEVANTPLSLHGESIASLRLPAAMAWPAPLRKALEARAAFQPDWVSLQFVPYAFHEKGIVAGLAGYLRKIIGEGSRLQITFHELWIGAHKEAPVKERVVGAFQRHYILSLLRTLKPDTVSTTNPTYELMLRNSGIAAGILPLFGNIPIAANNRLTLDSALASARASGDRFEPANLWLGVYFGALPALWSPEPLLSIFRRAARRANKQIHLISAGRLDRASEIRWERMGQIPGSEITFTRLGEQPDNVISLLLQSAHFGIATTPLQLIGKSGAVAAMIDHGLPIIVNRDNWHLRGSNSPGLPAAGDFFILNDELEERLVSGLPKKPPRETLCQVAAAFLASLESSDALTRRHRPG